MEVAHLILISLVQYQPDDLPQWLLTKSVSWYASDRNRNTNMHTHTLLQMPSWHFLNLQQDKLSCITSDSDGNNINGDDNTDISNRL